MTELDRILNIIETVNFVARDTRDGTNIYRASVYTRYGTRVTLTTWDGVSIQREATACTTLAWQLAGLRQATPEEIAEFERLKARRPAPSNWD